VGIDDAETEGAESGGEVGCGVPVVCEGSVVTEGNAGGAVVGAMVATMADSLSIFLS
jgi:hypothetical protein